MGQFSKTGVTAHDNACNLAEGIRQAAVAAAAQTPAGQVAVNNAEIAWARSCIASCKTNNGGAGQEAFIQVLRALGTGGV